MLGKDSQNMRFLSSVFKGLLNLTNLKLNLSGNHLNLFPINFQYLAEGL